MNNLAQQIYDTLLAQSIPIESISIGRRTDRATWRIDFAPSATDDQRAAAAALMAAFDPTQGHDENEQEAVAKHAAPFIAHVESRVNAIDARRADLAADLALLPTATPAQQRQIIARMLNAEANALTTEKRVLDWLVRIVKVLRR